MMDVLIRKLGYRHTEERRCEDIGITKLSASPERQPSEETNSADTLVSNFLASESETMDFCLSHFKYFGSPSIVTYQREGTDLGG